MGTSVLPARYRINGVVSTDKTVMQNMETLAGAAQSWLTYDITAGQWAVVINTTGNSVASFSDDNILGGITVSSSGLRDLYNRVRVEFPHVDLRDQPDFIEIAIPAEDRLPNEPDNTLEMAFDVINDPVMAEMLGLIELKQSRVDRQIQFAADWSYLGLTAGDLISVTNSALGYTNRVFRVISISESDADGGELGVQIQALEYDAGVYSLDDLYRYQRSDENGIRSIGAIDQPDAPTITAFGRDRRPRVVLETTAPAGIVEGMEFWFSTDGADFRQVGTARPLNSDVFVFAEVIPFEFDQVVTGNIYAQCRAINSVTSSEFSDTGSLLNFVSQQTTDAITQNTGVIDSATGNLLLANGLLALLGGLDGLYTGNTAGNSLFGTFWNLFAGNTGTDLLNNMRNGAIYSYDIYAESTPFISYNTGNIATYPYVGGGGGNIAVVQTGATGNVAQAVPALQTFTAVETGIHKVDAQIVGWYTNSNYDPRITQWKQGEWYLLTHPGGTLVASFSDNIRGDAFQDIPLPSVVTLTAGQSYSFRYYTAQERLPGTPANAAGHSLIVSVRRVLG